jgi:hypothetical protein
MWNQACGIAARMEEPQWNELSGHRTVEARAEAKERAWRIKLEITRRADKREICQQNRIVWKG